MQTALRIRPLPARLLVALAAAAVALPSFTAEARAATTWYAAPGGSGTACTQPSPCDVVYALETRPADGDMVVLSGGNYAIPAASFGIFVDKRISIEGPASGTPARLIADPGLGTVLNVNPASGPTLHVHVTDLQIQMEPGYGFGATNNGSGEMVIDRIRVDAPAGNGIPIALSQAGSGQLLLRNSISRVTGGGGIGINVFGPNSGLGEVQLRNVTVDASTGTGRGLVAQGGQNYGTSCGNLTVDVKNSYLRGGPPERDVRALGGTGVITDPPCPSIVNSSNSNWRSSESETGGVVNSIADQHNVDGSFVNAAGGDYRQLPSSQTIDKGVADSLIGPVDFEGEARISGTAPDIGADEYQYPPSAPKAPAGTALAFAPKRFAVDRKASGSIARKRKKVAKGSTVSYNLDSAANVTFTVERAVKGRKKGKKCSTKRKRGKRCTIYKKVKGSFSRASVAGANSFRFTGKLGGKALRAGSYRLSGLPTGSSGLAGPVLTARFTIVSS